MPIAFDNQVRVAIDVQGETVTFVCRRPTAKEVSDFLSKRFVQKRNKVEARLYEARQEFVDKIIVDIENAQFRNAAGETLELNKDTVLTDADKAYCSSVLGFQVTSWKDLISLNWKASAAQYFEDGQPEGDSGN